MNSETLLFWSGLASRCDHLKCRWTPDQRSFIKMSSISSGLIGVLPFVLWHSPISAQSSRLWGVSVCKAMGCTLSLLCKHGWTDPRLSHLRLYRPKATGHMKLCVSETHLGHLGAAGYSHTNTEAVFLTHTHRCFERHTQAFFMFLSLKGALDLYQESNVWYLFLTQTFQTQNINIRMRSSLNLRDEWSPQILNIPMDLLWLACSAWTKPLQ